MFRKLLFIISLMITMPLFASDTIAIDEKDMFKDNPQNIQTLLTNPVNDAKNKSEQQSGSLLMDQNKHSTQANWPPHDTPQPQNHTTSEVIMYPRTSNNVEGQPLINAIDKNKEPLIRNVPINAIYHAKRRNFISASGINAIVSPVTIKSFVPEPGAVTFQWINDNHGIAFQMKGMRSTFQAIVTFESDKAPVSLLFDVKNVPGRVIQLPSSLTGTKPLSTDPLLKKGDDFDNYVTQLMDTIVSNRPLSHAWQYQESSTVENPYNEVAITRYQHWFNERYSIKNFEICSKCKDTVLLDEKTFANTNTIAITLTKTKLRAGDCGRLVIMTRNTMDENSNDVYTPSLR